MKLHAAVVFSFLTCIAPADQADDMRLMKERLSALLAPDYRVSVGVVDGDRLGVKVSAEDAYRKRVPFVVRVELVFTPRIEDADWISRYDAYESARKKLYESKFSEAALREFEKAQRTDMPDGSFEGSSVKILGRIEPVPTSETEQAAISEAQRVHDRILSLVRLFKRPNHPPQRNAGSHPSSDDSPASETPSSLGPRR